MGWRQEICKILKSGLGDITQGARADKEEKSVILKEIIH